MSAIAAAGLAATTAAPAAADWSAPQTLSSPHGYAWPGAVAHTATGTAVASWSWQDGVGNGAATGHTMASRSPGKTAFGAARELPANVIAGPTPYGADRVLVAILDERRSGSTLRVRVGDLDGRVARPQVVARSPHQILRGELAANARGDAALVWREYRGAGRDRLCVRLRRAGRGFGPPIELGRGTIRANSVAVGPSGDVLVAWDARGRVRTRFKGHGQRGFGSVDELRSETTFHAALRTAITASGRAWVAWTSQLLTEGGGSGDAYVQVARRPPQARRFDAALLLDRAPSASIPSPVSLAVRPNGTAALAWTMWTGAPDAMPSFVTVRAAQLAATGLASVSVLSRFDAIEPSDGASVALGDDGDATVAWTRRTVVLTSGPQPMLASDTTAGYAAVRPAGDAWGPPELVTSSLQVFGLVPSYAPGGGAPTLLFATRPGGPGSTVVQAVTRG